MTPFLRTLLLLSCIIISGPLKSIANSNDGKAPVMDHPKMTDASLLFSENKGQVADMNGAMRPDILFTAHSGGTSLFITATGIHYQFLQTIYPEGYEHDARNIKNAGFQDALRRQIKRVSHRFTLSVEGANHHPRIRKEAANDFTENFYLPHCATGITGIHTYGRIVLEDVYPGIDWVIYSKEAGLKYDFVVHPDADAAQIKLKVQDAKDVHLNQSGDLVMNTSLGSVKEAAPVSYNKQQQIATRFVMGRDNTITFAVAPYNKAQELIIDPNVTWSTYYGGPQDEADGAVTTDGNGNVYMCGTTGSTTGIASGGYQNSFLGTAGTTSAYMAKFSATGARRWATYYGTFGTAYSCALDPAGNLYVAGGTYNATDMGYNAHQVNFGGLVDAYLVKFDANGARLWSTYYGGTDEEWGFGCATDTYGNVYLTGRTKSTTGIGYNGFMNNTPSPIYPDAFLVKFNSSGVRQWGTYYGGTGTDEGYSCATDANGNVYLAGYTASGNMSVTTGSYQGSLGGSNDAFLVKFSAAGVRSWATYLGGMADEIGRSCAVDINGDVYMAGDANTAGIAFGGHQNSYGGNGDGFLAKFSSAGSRSWITYYGGSEPDHANCCTTDATGCIYLIGQTLSPGGIASGGFQMVSAGGHDGFIAKFNSNGSRQWASYFGKSGDDIALSGIADGTGNVYVQGTTASPSGIGSGGFQNARGGGQDNFLLKIDDISLSTTVAANAYCQGAVVSVAYASLSTFNTGNIFTAQLSDASGLFITPVNIGALSSTFNYGTITATIPAGTPAGTNYRIRVNSSSPNITGYDNGTNITISGISTQPGPINGNATVCINSSQTYSIAPIAGASSYTWTLPAGWSGTSGTTSITAFAVASGTLSVTANYPCGPSAAQQLAITVVTAPPATPASISGPQTTCANLSQFYSTPPVTGASSYVWTLPTGWLGSSTTPSINVTTGSSSGTITVSAGNVCGNSSDQTFNVTAMDTPATPGYITGNDTVCRLSAQTYSVLSVPGAVSYTWSLPAGWNGTSATRTILVTAGTSGGIIKVWANNTCGSSAIQSRNIAVSQFTVPQPPVVSLVNGLLVSNIPNVQWYGPNGLIPSAVAQTYLPTVDGDYYAVALSNGCTSAASNIVHVIAGGVGIASIATEGVKIYPNPTKGDIFIEISKDKGPLTGAIYNTLGQKVVAGFIIEGTRKLLDLNSFANGVYFLLLQDEQGGKSNYPVVLSK